MGVESISVAVALSHADTVEISCHSPSYHRELLPALESWKAKDIQAIEAIQRTFTYKITEVQQHLNHSETLHELKLYSLQRPRERYIIIHISNEKTSKTWNTVHYSVSNKQKPSTIPSRKYNNCIWASVVQLVAKISEGHRKC